MRSDDGLVHNLALVGGSEAALPSKVAKLLMGQPHDRSFGVDNYRTIIIIKL